MKGIDNTGLFRFSLLICTYNRPHSLNRLLESVVIQKSIPDQIIIIDGSINAETEEMIKSSNYSFCEYYKVEEKDRGLTRQRNFGISKLKEDINIVCFLDDDTVLEIDYFQNLIKTYEIFPHAIGVGGYILGEVEWRRKSSGNIKYEEFEYDNYIRKLGSRNLLRKKLGLLSDDPPGIMPEFSNGLSISFLPPSGKTYPVEFFMGGVASYQKKVFQNIRFSSFFEGYGLYEDLDFCLRVSRLGQLYVNTSAKLYHYHQDEGRPNKFEYGKMVIKNGWYVWRIKFPSPNFKNRLKWHGTAFLLTLIRFLNVFSTKNKNEAFTESMGRAVGWWQLLFKKPNAGK